MDFHLEFSPRPQSRLIAHDERILLIGSCFTENIGQKLRQHKFSVLENPHGILFNPASIVRAVTHYISGQRYQAADLFYQNELWNSWDHHSRFSHCDRETALDNINASTEAAHQFLSSAGWLMITIGSAFVYEREGENIVANCHKVPTDKFRKRLLEIGEIKKMLMEMRQALQVFNPGLQLLFTISPVRHLRDGFIENNRSKARLIEAVHAIVAEDPASFYFPAYELVIDDLRDHRFYAEDMVHPNYAATNYVWEKFVNACIDPSAKKLMPELHSLQAALHHRAFNPGSEQHRKFLAANLAKTQELAARYPYMDFEKELAAFGGI